MEIIRLTAGECRLLVDRYRAHGNSHRRMSEALEAAGETDRLERLEALRQIERRFAIDLGSLCHRIQRQDAETTHPLERMVLRYMAAWRERPEGGTELWVHLDRVRQVRALIEEDELVREPES